MIPRPESTQAGGSSIFVGSLPLGYGVDDSTRPELLFQLPQLGAQLLAGPHAARRAAWPPRPPPSRRPPRPAPAAARPRAPVAVGWPPGVSAATEAARVGRRTLQLADSPSAPSTTTYTAAHWEPSPAVRRGGAAAAECPRHQPAHRST